MQGDVPVGTLVLGQVAQPWFECSFRPTSAWEALRPTVEAWTRAVESDDSNEDEISRALEAVDALKLTLVSVPGSETIEDFLIHVEGDTARFRH
ncbi:hypothetical protein AMK10_10615 [Streptomyces sp. CB02058]|nr:hypothetical protein AMK10_10615 [Streptomyces sp. CB02058]